MPKVGDIERITQNRIIKLFCDKDKLDYRYLGNLIDQSNVNINETLLSDYLRKTGYSETLIAKSIEQLVKVANVSGGDLYSANKEVYSLLRYGAKVKEKQGEKEKSVFFINWNNAEKNDFAIAEEVTIIQNFNKRPDIVVYVNGIALATIELKRSTVSVSNGIRQNLDNQRYIKNFFSTVQLCVAGNDSEGLRYGVIDTKEKYYLEWKNFAESTDGESKRILDNADKFANNLDKAIVSVFDKKRFLEIVHDFIIYDRGIKKTCRHNQYFGVKEAQEAIKSREGGIIWHTQGSGKSLTMVWLSKWILENKSNARVLIITDREELDEQIEKIYLGANETISRTISGKDLIDKINSHNDRLMCSLIHKFGKRGGEAAEKDYEVFIQEIKKSLPKDFSPKGDIYVFVDECHRTQSGKLHKAMKAILPSSIFIGFTGTPLLKTDKATSARVFGRYIHKYLFNEAVTDGVVLDLRYEARDIPQNLMAQDKVDLWFDQKTRGLNDRAKARLKTEWATMQKVFSSKGRIERIAQDIKFDMETKARLLNGRGNAMLVVEDIYTACRYYEEFLQINFDKCAIITSYVPNKKDLSCESVDESSKTENQEKYEIYIKMLGGKNSEEFEAEAKRKFIREPAKMKLLIVVDKLLTGFDAPPATYLYIDKSMKDHGLFQAICRVNRLDGEDKTFGFIVDYNQLFGQLGNAISDYTAGAFENFDKDDIEGLIKNNKEEAKSFFEETLRELDSLCEGVAYPKTSLEYQHYFCGEESFDAFSNELLARNREKLYKLTNKLFRAYTDLACYLEDFYESKQIKFYDERVKFYLNLKAEIGRASADFLDLKLYEPDMRYLIDTFISADAAQKISALDNLSVLQFINSFMEKNEQNQKDEEGAAEVIENNIRKKIIEKNARNPKYYESMSAILERLILDRKKGVIAFKELLRQYAQLENSVEQPQTNSRYPASIKNNGALRAIYDNVGEDEELAHKIDDAVISTKQDQFRGNVVKENKIKRELERIVGVNNDAEVERIFKLICEQEEY